MKSQLIPKELVEAHAKSFLNSFNVYTNMEKDKRVKASSLKTQLWNVEREFFQFQNTLNNYLNQWVKILYVYHDENKDVKIAVADNNIQNLTPSLSYKIKEITLILNEEKFFNATPLNETEKNIQQRWASAKNKFLTKSKKKNRANFLPILWKINGKWEGMKINNLGTIAEAYTKFYINHIDFSLLQNDEYRVCFFIRHPIYGAVSVDNTPGLLIGDIDTFSSLNLAVKKEDASSAKYQTLANILTSMFKSNNFNIEKIQEKFQDEGVKNQAIELTTKELSDAINKLTNLDPYK